MELRRLRYFIAVAEEGHVTRAAERLGIQQPPLSRLIQSVERELDVQLFRRRARGVELTDAGRAFFEKSRALLADLDHAIETTRRTARGEQGHISVGVTPTAPFHPFVPRVFRAFRETFPMVTLTLEEAHTLELVDHLRDEKIDAAFIRTPLADPEGLTVTPVVEEPLIAALPSGHKLARDSSRTSSVSLKDLAAETFILYGRPLGPAVYEATIAACHAAGFSPRVQEAARITSTMSLVAAGLGVAVVPASLQRMNMDGVTFRHVKGTTALQSPINLVSRRGDPSATVRQFLLLVKKATKKFVSHQ
jgi:DNA-binding transcriptional LysR family regulator